MYLYFFCRRLLCFYISSLLGRLYCHSSIAIIVAVVVFCVIAGRPHRSNWLSNLNIRRRRRRSPPVLTALAEPPYQLVVNLPSPKEQEALKAKRGRWNEIESNVHRAPELNSWRKGKNYYSIRRFSCVALIFFFVLRKCRQHPRLFSVSVPSFSCFPLS